jgi:hypothetical protein
MEPEWWWPKDTREWIFLTRALETIRQRMLTSGAKPKNREGKAHFVFFRRLFVELTRRRRKPSKLIFKKAIS